MNESCPVCSAEGAKEKDCGRYVFREEYGREADDASPSVEDVQALIDSLLDGGDITSDNRTEVEELLNEIDTLKLLLDTESFDTLDFTRYGDAVSALNALDGMAGAEIPSVLEGDDIPQVTVTYSDGVNGTVFADIVHTVNAGAATPKPPFEYGDDDAPYVFYGWSPSIAEIVTEDVTYTAVWEVDEDGDGFPDRLESNKFTVKYVDTIEDEYTFAAETYEASPLETTPAFSGGTPTRKGYTFKGWGYNNTTKIYTTENLWEEGYNTEILSFDHGVLNIVKGNVTYYAIWQKHDSKLTFNGAVIFYFNGGTLISDPDETYSLYSQSSDIPVMDFVIPDVEVVREGYKLEGWALTSDATAAKYTVGSTMKVNCGAPADYVVYAV